MKSAIVLLVLNFVLVSFGFSIPQKEDIEPNIRFDGFSERIVGGNEALDEQFPYQVGLVLTREDGTSWCGGSLIARKWVLTAAHCLYLMVSAQVYLGVHNIYATHEVGRQIIDVSVANFIIHPSYDKEQHSDDIALIRLPVEARISRDIQLISLPDANDNTELYEGVTAVASGWGRASDSSTAVSPVLRYTDLEVISNADCRMSFGNVIRLTNMCTSGAKLKSPCNGDSGGPLVYEKNKTKTLIGLTSFGSSSGCEKGYPAVFTRVTQYNNWIREMMLTYPLM